VLHNNLEGGDGGIRTRESLQRLFPDYKSKENGRLKHLVADLSLDNTILKEAQVMIEVWRHEYNTVRPHSSLGYRSPVPATLTLQPSPFQPLVLTL